MARRPAPMRAPVPGRPTGALSSALQRRPAKPAPAGKPFHPFVEPQPPAGTYDPMLNSQEAAAHRGYSDLKQDLALQGARSLTDYTTSLNRMNLQKQYEAQDYARNTGLLQRRYGIMAGQQGQAANAAGLEGADGSGFDVASATMRAQNQRIQQQGMDIAHQRAVTSEDLGQAQLGLTYNRGGEDRATQLARAGRENTFFGQDIASERAYQSGFMGYVPPSPPSNELTRAGVTYRLGAHGVATLPSGQTLNPGQLNNMLYQRGWRPKGWRPGQAIPGVGGAPVRPMAGGFGSEGAGTVGGGLGY